MTQKTTFKIFTFLCVMLFQLGKAQPYVNGPLSTGATSNNGVAAPTGYTWSECQNNTGNTTESNTNSGFSCFYNTANTSSFRIADDFTVPASVSWNVTSFEFFCYQTSYSGTVPPIDGLRVQIWDGDPSLATSTVVSGDMTTNVYDAANSSDALMYRIFNSAVPAVSAPTTARKIWKVRANLTTTLNPGTYWVVYQTHATNDATIFVPSATVVGSRGLAGWNSKQLNAVTNAWSDLVDGGNPATAPDVPQDMAFNINYTEGPLSNDSFVESNLKLYPNPSADAFVIENTNASNTISSVALYDVKGAKVVSFKNQESYSVKDLISGVYFVKIYDDKNTLIETLKLIKE